MIEFSMRKVLFASVFFVIAAFALPQTASAEIINKKVDRTFDVQTDRVHVTERSTIKVVDGRYLIPAGSEEVFIVFNPILDDEKAQERIQQTMPTIKVTDGNGKAIPFTTRVNGQSIEIIVIITTGVQVNQSKTYQVEYDSFALLNKAGAIYDLYIPTFASEFQFEDDTTSRTINTVVNIPKSLGPINFVNPTKTPVDLGTKLQYQYSQQELTGTVSWIQIGNKQYYKFDIRQPYTATSNVPVLFNTYSVILPRSIVSGSLTQTVNFTSITPAPEAIYRDENDNLVARFAIPANETGEIVVSGYAEVEENNQFDMKNSGSLSDLNSNVLGVNIANADFWEVNAPEIQAKAQELKGTETNIYKLITKTYQYVVDQIDYSEVKRFGINERQGALKTLQGGAAVCMEYSDLFIALMRAQGVPARAAFGYGYDTRATNGIDTAHQWAEVYLPSQNRWVSIDTTWGESGTDIIGGNLNHFFKYVANINPNDPAPVSTSYYGKLNEIPSDSFQILAVESIPAKTKLISEDELLAQYPEKKGTDAVFENVARSLQQGIAVFDGKVTSFFVDTLQLPQDIANVVKLIVYLIPVILIATLVTRSIRNRRRHNSVAVEGLRN